MIQQSSDTRMSLWSRARRGVARVFGRSQEQRSNKQWRRNTWGWLSRIDELAHYSVLVGYVQYLKPNGSVLDIGCGEGLLKERLGSRYSRYVGVDFEAAITQAAQRADERSVFMVGDMHTVVPDGRFDVIIFNESAYYFDDIVRGLRRFEAFLADGGVFLVSMFAAERNAPRWDALRAAYDILDDVTVRNAEGREWRCAALAPHGAPFDRT
jgi:SAM-dependent methyltransferase